MIELKFRDREFETLLEAIFEEKECKIPICDIEDKNIFIRLKPN